MSPIRPSYRITPPAIHTPQEGAQWLWQWNNAPLVRGSEQIVDPWKNTGQDERKSIANCLLMIRDAHQKEARP
jgi:hypothetical protein